MNESVWITWEAQRRNHSMARALGFELHEILCSGSPLLRYFKCLARTLFLLIRRRPGVVVAQNPSVILCALVALLKPLVGFVFVMDAHNSGVRPWEGRSRVLNFAAGVLFRAADITIVSNEGLTDEVHSRGGLPVVVPDPLPTVPPVEPRRLSERFSVAFVCTFSADEPYLEVFEAARSLAQRADLFVTGRCPDGAALRVADNVRILGFLSDVDYWTQLASADIVMDLTTREDCLVCGAYEAVALGKAQVLSDTAALRAHFSKGAVYTRPDSQSISRAIERACNSCARLTRETQELREELASSWEGCARQLVEAIEQQRGS